MSRSGYSEDCENWDLVRWRGAVQSAIRGARGQKFLRELVAALDALPEKKLIAHELKDENGAVCALGSVAVARGLDVSGVDFEDRDKGRGGVRDCAGPRGGDHVRERRRFRLALGHARASVRADARVGGGAAGGGMNWYIGTAILVLVLLLWGLLADERAAHERTRRELAELRGRLWVAENRARLGLRG